MVTNNEFKYSRKKQLKVGLVSLLGGEHLGTDRKNVQNDLEPFGLLYIGGVAKAQGYETRIFHPYQKANPDEESIAKAVTEFKPEILGISSMTNTFNRSVALAQKVKARLPHTKIVFGGDHIGTNPRDVIQGNVIDVGVYGEGEETFRELLENYNGSGKSLEEIKGISFVKNREIIITEKRPRVMDRTQLPKPLRDEEILKTAKVGVLMYPAPSEQTGAASLLFQFGCPFGCKYCSATTLYGSKLTRSSVECVVEEMKDLKEQFGINTAFFTDLTFNLNYKLSEELCANLERAQLGVNWTAMVRPTSPNNQPILKDSTIEAMVAGGCSKVAFGIESFEESAMQAYHRPTSLDEDYRTLRKIDEAGALSKVFLILGHPDETLEYYNEVISVLKTLMPDEVRISFLTPFPGTPLWNDLEEKRNEVLLTTNYDDYTTFKPIMKMNHISPDQLIKQRQRILHEYYNSNEYTSHVRKKVARTPKFKKSFDEFNEELKRRELI
jgi:anaerobic magnesium-protoporphyrin IX monomethyl ester cyclase